jgi:hypothetical protein
VEVRETWYFGEPRGADGGGGVAVWGSFARKAGFLCRLFGIGGKEDLVLGRDVGARGGKTSPALLVVLELARLEGSSGFGSGGCALSDSVTASAAARSAARAASLGVLGAAAGACEGAVGREGLAVVWERSWSVSKCHFEVYSRLTWGA